MLALLALILTSCAHRAIAPSPSDDWCNSGRVETSDGPWHALGRDAVAPVSQRHLTEAVAKLLDRTLISVSRQYAERIVSSSIVSAPGDAFFLARAGLVGGVEVPLHQYMVNAGSAVSFKGEVGAGSGKLLISTVETSPRYATRRIPVVVRTNLKIRDAASRCLHVR